MENCPIKKHDVVRGFPNSQVGSKTVLAVGQDDVDFVQSLRVIVANVEEMHAISEGIAPKNLIHRQLANDVRLGTILVKTLNGDDQVTDVIILFASG